MDHTLPENNTEGYERDSVCSNLFVRTVYENEPFPDSQSIQNYIVISSAPSEIASIRLFIINFLVPFSTDMDIRLSVHLFVINLLFFWQWNQTSCT